MDKIDEELMTKLASKVFLPACAQCARSGTDVCWCCFQVDGGDAENKFMGSDQTLDSLIAGMEQAQVLTRNPG